MLARAMPSAFKSHSTSLILIGAFVFGVLLFARPGVGAVTLALLFGLYALIYGFSQITAGIQLRQIGADAEPPSELRHSG